MVAFRFSATRLSPSEMATRLSKAHRRAFASETTGNPPNPISRRWPSMVTRCTHDFEPPGATCRNRVPPSPYRPGFVRGLNPSDRQFSHAVLPFSHGSIGILWESNGTVKPAKDTISAYLRAFCGFLGSVAELDGRWNWWSRWGSNPRPLDCEPSALPAELRPHVSRRPQNVALPQPTSKCNTRHRSEGILPSARAGRPRSQVVALDMAPTSFVRLPSA